MDGFGGYTYVGLANYRQMADDPLFAQSLQVTLKYVPCSSRCSTSVGLGLALLVKRPSSASIGCCGPCSSCRT